MKICPTCNRTYTDETLNFCLQDGSTLSPTYDPDVTRHTPDPRSTDPEATKLSPPSAKPPLQPTIPAPPPLYSQKPPLRAKAKRGGRTGLILAAGAVPVVMLAALIAVILIWLGRENATNTQSNSKIPNTNAPSTSAPGPAVNVSGRWSGSWKNTKGEKGTSTIRIVEDANGLIKGDEDGWLIENGSRTGNVLTWTYHNINNGCRDYQVRLEISDSGKVANGTYEAQDRCEKRNYSGSYINYRKQ